MPKYTFEGFVLDVDRASLEHDGRERSLRPQSFAILCQIVKNARRLIEKEELRQAIWRGTAVTEDSLVQCLGDIRRALGDREALLRTIPRRGYMLDADVAYHPTAVAVLPFADLGGDPNGEEYLGEGLAEAVITQLTRMPALRVASRSASFRFRGSDPDLRTIGTVLRVDSVIEGSVRRADDRLRIDARLVALPEGMQLWSETFEGPRGDIFALEDELARAIAARLMQPGTEHAPVVMHRRPENAEAYRLYLTGRYFWNKRSGPGLLKAIRCWEQALEKEPRYALAHSGIADGYTLLAYFGHRAPHDAFPRVEAEALSALAIDENLAEAHASLANHRLHYQWDLGKAKEELDRAIALNPDYHHAYHVRSHYCIAAGDLAGSLTASLRGLEIEPLDVVLIGHLGWHHLHAGSYERGVEACRRALDMDPGFVAAHIYLGQLLTELGRYEEAIAALERAELSGGSAEVQGHVGLVHALAGRRREALRARGRLLRLAKQQYVSAYHVGVIHLALGERGAATIWLRQAISERSRFMTYWRTDPPLRRLLGARHLSRLMREVDADTTSVRSSSRASVPTTCSQPSTRRTRRRR